MGWKDSTPYFYAHIKTVNDIVNKAILLSSENHHWLTTAHLEENKAMNIFYDLDPLPTTSNSTSEIPQDNSLYLQQTNPSDYFDVFEDEFIAIS